MAAAQLGYFQAVNRMTVGVALLIEYLGIVLVVLWVWALTRVRPHRLTGLGIVLAIGGLALVLDITGQSTPSLVGVLWGLLAATGLAGHYVLAGRPTVLPATAFAGLGLAVGAVVLALLGLVGVLPMERGTGAVLVAGSEIPAWLAIGELVVVAAALAYVLGVVGARHLGSTLASFVGLTEVLFAVLFAWLVLAELPRARPAGRGRRPPLRGRRRPPRRARPGPTRGARPCRPISTFPRPSPRLGGLPRRGTSHRTPTCGPGRTSGLTHP